MKKILNGCVVVCLSLLCFSCGNGGGSDSTAAAKDSNAAKMDSTKNDSTKMAMPASVSKADATFAVNTADAGMTEIQAGQLAEKMGTAKDVKDYGAMMVKDHTEAADKLKTLAASKNITLPTTLSSDAQKTIDDLQKKQQGKDFDKAYFDQMISDHKKVISAFEDESKNGSDADIRAFADNTLTTLRHHLDEAEKCRKMMKK